MPHKFGCGEITRHLGELADAHGTSLDVEVIGERLRDVTSQNRCFVGEEEQRVISSLLRKFPEDFAAELEGGSRTAAVPVPKILDIRDGVAVYDEKQMRKRPDWTYAPR